VRPDWNGDGIVDLVVGERGRVCIRFGGKAGLHAACDVSLAIHELEPDDPIVAVDARTIAVGVPGTVTSAEKGEQFRGGAVMVLRAGHKTVIDAPDGAPARLGSSLAAVDRDGDGRVELLATASSLPPHPEAGVYDVSSHDAKQVWSTPASATIAGAGDLDGDGRGDVVVVSDQVRVWSGSQGPPGTAIEGVTTDAVHVLVDDVDRDGYDDLVIARLDHAPNQVLIYRGGAHGLEVAPSSTITAPDPQLTGFGAAIAILGGDARVTLAIGCTGDRKVRFYHAGETAPFAEWGPDPTVVGFPRSLVAGDFDGDGRDEVVARSAAGELWWFRGSLPPVPLR